MNLLRSRSRRKILVAAAGAVAATLVMPTAAFGQAWPSKPIRLVVPFSAGGTVDVVARIVATSLQEGLGQPVIVENRAGAGGLLAGEHVMRSAPDGYTFFFTSNGPLLYAPITFGKPSYQWDKDFDAVGSVSFTPMTVHVTSKLPVTTFAELLELIKKDPAKVNMATAGSGTVHHILSEILQARTGLRWETVHYKGSTPAIQDLIGGQVQFGMDPLPSSLPYIKDGRLRPLAVTARKRIPELPQVPTLIELGMTDLTAEAFTGVLSPKGTPQAVLDRMQLEMAKVLAEPAVIARLGQVGAEARAMKSPEFTAYLRKEYDTWTPILRKLNIRTN